MPVLPVLIVGGIAVGAYVVGRFFKNEKEHDLENELSISEALRTRDRKKTRNELLEELKE